MVRNQHLDLDNLDSPLVSPSPLTSVGGIPGSAIAEKIFNDPDSWDNPLEQDFGATNLEMAWLADEVEKLKRLSMDANEREFVLSMEQNDLILRAFPDHYKVAQLHDGVEISDGIGLVYEGIKQDITGPLVLLPQIGTGKKGDMPDGFAKIWQTKGLRPPPSPLSFSPPSSSDSFGGFEIQLQEPSPTEATPPPKVASASTTWSFLEWYGIHPESPGKQVKSAAVQQRKPRPRGILQGSTPLMSALSQPPTSPPKVPLPPIPAQSAREPDADRPSSAVRRLPAVPPSAEAPKTGMPFSCTLRPSPALPINGRRPSEPAMRSARPLMKRSPSEPRTSLPSSVPTASSLRTLSVRSPPPIGPRPKGFVQRGESPQMGRASSRSPPRTLALRPPALNI
ncbi:hypothetical protein AX14_010767 [Amanita brunnescens Koide BX004]|nr:hypothetical protein AX14_010767 [Amanita brunnescens Koide BX004]